MILLAVDIGNSTTTVGLFIEERLSTSFNFPTRVLTHRQTIQSSLDESLRNIAAPEVIAIASVVPWASDELIGVLHEFFGEATILVLSAQDIPLTIEYPDPNELGTDRLLAASAAYALWGKHEGRPSIVIDLGTATTYDCVTKDGIYLGGAIAPGIMLNAESLAERTAQLPMVPLEFPPSVIGKSTVESMQSGILYGALSSMEGMVARFRDAAFGGVKPIVVATGGLSELMQTKTDLFDHLDPLLVLQGVRIAAQQIPASHHAEQASFVESDHQDQVPA